MDKTAKANTSIPITQLADEDKPREKMLLQGKKSLTNSELLAILLRTGVHGKNCLEIAQEMLLKQQGKITNLARMEVQELKHLHNGIGTAKAVTILAALELGNRMLSEQSNAVDEVVRNAADLFKFASSNLIDQPTEEFWVICLNQRNKITWKQQISCGGITSTSVDIRLVFGSALEHHAVAIAVMHNHPSGSLEPSEQDKKLTSEISAAAKILHIRMLDHLIVGITASGKGDYFSFAENGLL